MNVPAFFFCRRAGLALAMAAICAAGAFEAAEAAQKKTPDKKEDAAKPALVASFGDWNVFVGQAGKGRICYTLAQPKTREPAGLNRDPGYAFISDRPTEGVRNEVSFIMGFDVAAGPDSAGSKLEPKTPGKSASKSDSKSKAAPAAAPVAAVEEATFELLPKGANLWVKNAARESELIAVMRKGTKLTLKASSLKGHVSTDVYSLAGFSQAMDRLLKECPGK
jgi:invasion protein IalB